MVRDVLAGRDHGPLNEKFDPMKVESLALSAKISSPQEG